MPKVSVVIPAHNYGRLIGETLRSVLSQTFVDLEAIVVDDGSTDNTKDIVRGINDSRIRYIYQENQGLAAARNTGIKAGSGEYLAFVDADDLWMPEKLDRQLSVLCDRADVGLVYGSYMVIDENGKVLVTRNAGEVPYPLLPSLVRTNLVAGSATTSVVRRRCFDYAGLFDETLRACEDWDMWLRIACHAQFAAVQEPIAKLRLHSSNMTSDSKRMEIGLQTVVNKFFSNPELPRDIRVLKRKATAGAYFHSAVFYLRNGKRNPAISRLVRTIILDPTWPDPYIVLARVFRSAVPSIPKQSQQGTSEKRTENRRHFSTEFDGEPGDPNRNGRDEKHGSLLS